MSQETQPSSEFYHFPHIDVVHMLLDLSLSISGIGGRACVDGIFLTSNFACSLLVYGKAMTFCM